ncbi:MAG: isoprenyl transferase [Proteobacteria bacterium]|nr:isoprenyl transferase [Pseudomonadota bacterium]
MYELQVPTLSLPRHVGIIMDGNGRWAKKRNRPRVFGHKNGVDAVRQVVKSSGEWGIPALTLYAFSDENWQRPRDEVGVIMSLLESYILKEKEELNRNNVRLRVIGELDRLNPRIREILTDAVSDLSSNTGLILTLALSYGGRSEITRAVRMIAKRIEDGNLSSKDITNQLISDHLDTSGLPDPDLIIRTSGEQRLSNFLLWQSAYAELYFTDVLWPDFSKEEFSRAIVYFGTRERRFGRTSDQLSKSRNLQSETSTVEC